MDGYDWKTRLLTFLAMEHGLMMLKVAVSVGTPDVPDEVQIQLDRQEFIVGKLIEDKEDDQDPPLDEVDDPTDAAVEVLSTDADTVLVLDIEEDVRAALKRRAKGKGGAPAEETVTKMVSAQPKRGGGGGAKRTWEELAGTCDGWVAAGPFVI